MSYSAEARSILLSVVMTVAVLARPVQAGATAQKGIVVRIQDTDGMTIPFAIVDLPGNVQRASDAHGSLRVIVKADSIELRVRRIGYSEKVAWVFGDRDTSYVTLTRVAQKLGAVEVGAVRDTPLSRTRFYDRMAQVQGGAIVGEFITPEELEVRSAGRLSDMLRGRRYVAVKQAGSRGAVLTGRGGCGMQIIVDGIRINNTLEAEVGTASQSIRSGRSAINTPMSIDEIVEGTAVMAIEIYPSTANAPAELIPLTDRGSCGIVAIWTGPRR